MLSNKGLSNRAHTHNVMAFSSRCVRSSVTWIHFKLSRRERERDKPLFLIKMIWCLMVVSDIICLLALPAGPVLIIFLIIKSVSKKIILLLSRSLSKHISPTHLFVPYSTTSIRYNPLNPQTGKALNIDWVGGWYREDNMESEVYSLYFYGSMPETHPTS